MNNIFIDELSIKISKIIDKYDYIKKDNIIKDNLLIKKDKDHFEIKKQLDALIKERDEIKRKLDKIVEKIDSLELF